MAVIIFKPVEKCNSNCIYCDVIKKQQEQIMSYELLELIYNRIGEFLEANPKEKVSLTWHGGEVCLLKAEYFHKAYELQQKHCKNVQHRIEHLIQSNLTLINQEIIDALKKLNITHVGSSYDFIPGVRGLGKDRNTKAYNKLLFQGFRLLEKNNMDWGFIYVVTRRCLDKPLDVFHHLTNLSPKAPPMLNIIYVYGDDPHNLAVTNEEFADFLGAIFPYWYKNRNRFPNIKPFVNFLKSYESNNSFMGCELSGRCAYRWVYIGPTGETSQCGRGGDFNLISYGSILDRSLQEIMSDKKRDEIDKRNVVLPEGECKDCRFWSVCHGCCPLDSIQEYNTFLKKSPNCVWVKNFLEKYFEPVTGYKFNVPTSN
jgi:uncharacterized protein